MLALLEVQGHPHVSTAVVSKVLARSAEDKAVTYPSCGFGRCSTGEFCLDVYVKKILTATPDAVIQS
jgi:hypothetical protein